LGPFYGDAHEYRYCGPTQNKASWIQWSRLDREFEFNTQKYDAAIVNIVVSANMQGKPRQE